MAIQIEFESHKDEVLDAMEDAVMTALEAVGLTAEAYAKLKCPVDTGLLRNSITHAVSGVPFRHSYHASYGSNKYVSKKGEMKRRVATSKNAGSVAVGRVSGMVGIKEDHEVYIGTNVEYAPYVEYGTSKMKAKPFLKPAAEGHVAQYKKIFENYLQNA